MKSTLGSAVSQCGKMIGAAWTPQHRVIRNTSSSFRVAHPPPKAVLQESSKPKNQSTHKLPLADTHFELSLFEPSRPDFRAVLSCIQTPNRLQAAGGNALSNGRRAGKPPYAGPELANARCFLPAEPTGWAASFKGFPDRPESGTLGNCTNLVELHTESRRLPSSDPCHPLPFGRTTHPQRPRQRKDMLSPNTLALDA